MHKSASSEQGKTDNREQHLQTLVKNDNLVGQNTRIAAAEVGDQIQSTARAARAERPNLVDSIDEADNSEQLVTAGPAGNFQFPDRIRAV